MPMKCDRLLNDALNLHIDPEARAALNAMRKPAISGYTPKEGVGIDINSKLMTALAKIVKHENSSMFGSPYIKKESLYKRLTNEGVSKKEIDLYLGDLLNKEVLTPREKQLIKMLTPQERAKLGLDIKRTTIGRDKVYVGEALKRAEAKKLQVKTISDNKFSNITYDGQGIDNPSYEVRGLVMPGSKVGGSPGHFPSENGLIGWSRSYVGTQPGIEGKVLRLDEFQSDWAQNPDLLNDLGDLPIDHNDFKKLMIVDGIDRAMQNGLDTIVIPITRTSNNLVGTSKVSQNYLDLQKGILPKIRQELDRAGLKLDVKKASGAANKGEAWILKIEDKTGKAIKQSAEGYSNTGMAIGKNLETMKKQLEQMIVPIHKLPGDTKVYAWLNDIDDSLLSKVLDNASEYDRTGQATVAELKRLLSFKEEMPAESYEELHDLVYGNSGVILTKNKNVVNYDTVIDNLTSTLNIEDAYDFYKDLIPNFPEFFKSPPDKKSTKYRWDALSVATTLGLGEAYSKLQEGES